MFTESFFDELEKCAKKRKDYTEAQKRRLYRSTAWGGLGGMAGAGAVALGAGAPHVIPIMLLGSAAGKGVGYLTARRAIRKGR